MDETGEFPQLLAAMKEHYKSETALATAQKKYEDTNWKIGDAAIEECGEPGEHGVNDGSYKEIEKAAKILSKKLDKTITLGFLRDRRDISHLYPDAERSASVSWSVYAIFRGYPDDLLEWIKANPGNKMSAATARTIVADKKKAEKEAATQPDQPTETDTDTETDTETDTDAIVIGDGGGADHPEPAPLGAQEDTNDGLEGGETILADDEEKQGEEKGEKEDTHTETEEEAEMRLSKEKHAKEEKARLKTEELKDVAKEIAKFVEGNPDTSRPWNGEIQQNIKIAIKDLNWVIKQLKTREQALVDAAAPKPKRTRRSPKPNGSGDENVSHALH